MYRGSLDHIDIHFDRKVLLYSFKYSLFAKKVHLGVNPYDKLYAVEVKLNFKKLKSTNLEKKTSERNSFEGLKSRSLA